MTPSDSDSFQLTQLKSMSQMGWSAVQQALAGQAESDLTRERCAALLPEPEHAPAQRRLDETAEMVAALTGVDPVPLQPFDDLHPVLQLARESLWVEPALCLQAARQLRLVRDLRKFFRKQENAPLLKTIGEQLDPLPDVLKEIDRCLEPDGEIKEDASPELKQAIRDAAKARQSLETSLQKIMNQTGYKDALQDSYFTEREGRLVLPVKAEARSRLDGIVHDSSGSGQTLFVEPASVIPLNNQLKIARLTVEQEKIKILENLARLLMIHEDVLKANQELLIRIDQIHARGRLAETMQARNFLFREDGMVRLRQARNPELILNGQTVIPNDIQWQASTQVIIISGPNTGGKTVTLKTVGLMSLMARAGLFLPVAENSEIGFFPEVYADIGDEQNIEMQLSTFSAHLEKIIYILNHASAGALVLLDELGIATDPQEGAALAESILIEMKQRGLIVLVSTHYLAIKTLAQTEAGFLNACTEFDEETHRPTYRLIFGVPGHSAALDTAQRLGLKASTLERARAIYERKDRKAEQLLQDLNRQKLKLENERELLRKRQEDTQKLLEEQKVITENLKAEEADFLKTKAKKVQTFVRQAKRDIRQLMEGLRKTRDIRQLKKAEKKVHQLGKTPASSVPKPGWDVPADQLQSGDRVRVENYDAFGTLLEDPKGKSRVRIQLGNLKTVADIQYLKGNKRAGPAPPSGKRGTGIHIQTEARPTSQATCDLRGQSVANAREAMEVFLSRAIVNKRERVIIIHGHGMGKLKQMVREYLDASGIGKNHHPGDRHEGGDGVTVVEF
ncbi:MAG: endonuclease MutS2 [Nitrospinaceae bacterium]|nr:endonuclease MutS2 [Nitrospinaceae bacterium]NIR57777.1 endonuclease MutS2 [Nitrospinaceae bacterium]NIS88239.1 endonuclease MutS2 [Nitrospinaceae bacterium]NIT85119.1 endonuclease MutS2 [Nitrospinaceae bacterium]NIU47276.1 endonuclease MutS2 [Nitrospinaceae bacterium]